MLRGTAAAGLASPREGARGPSGSGGLRRLRPTGRGPDGRQPSGLRRRHRGRVGRAATRRQAPPVRGHPRRADGPDRHGAGTRRAGGQPAPRCGARRPAAAQRPLRPSTQSLLLVGPRSRLPALPRPRPALHGRRLRRGAAGALPPRRGAGGRHRGVDRARARGGAALRGGPRCGRAPDRQRGEHRLLEGLLGRRLPQRPRGAGAGRDRRQGRGQAQGPGPPGDRLQLGLPARPGDRDELLVGAARPWRGGVRALGGLDRAGRLPRHDLSAGGDEHRRLPRRHGQRHERHPLLREASGNPALGAGEGRGERLAHHPGPQLRRPGGDPRAHGGRGERLPRHLRGHRLPLVQPARLRHRLTADLPARRPDRERLRPQAGVRRLRAADREPEHPRRIGHDARPPGAQAQAPPQPLAPWPQLRAGADPGHGHGSRPRAGAARRLPPRAPPGRPRHEAAAEPDRRPRPPPRPQPPPRRVAKVRLADGGLVRLRHGSTASAPGG